jgi:hypothetical protein
MWLPPRHCLAVTRRARPWKKQNIKEAIALYLESLAEHGEPIPEEGPSFQGRVSVPVPA